MESIVKMGVSGKNTYGKNAPEDNQYPPRRQDDSGAGTEKESVSAEKAKAVPAVSADKKNSKKQELEKKKAEEIRREEQRRAAEEERILHRKRRKHYSMIARYVVYTVVVCYVFLRLTDNFSSILRFIGRGVGMIGALLMPLFWGFVLAYILEPVVEMLEDRLNESAPAGRRRGSRHGLAVAITCAAVLLVLVVILSLIVSAFSRSLQIASLDDLVALVQSFAGTLQSFQQTIMNRLADMNVSSEAVSSALQQIGVKTADFTNGLSNSLTGALGQVGGFLTNLLFTVIFAIYFLLDSKSLARYWDRVLVAVGGKTVRKDLRILGRDADEVFSGYIRGQLIDAVIMAILVSSALSLIGVKYAIIIGVLSGIGNLIPYVGPVVAYGSTILVCLISGDFRRLLVAIVVLFVIQTIDGNIINPRLLSTNVDVHPVLVIAALIVGGAIGGIVGMLFAVPVAAFFKIQFEKVIDRLLIARFPEKEKKVKRRGHASDREPVRTSDLTAAPEKAKEQEAADQNRQSVSKPLTDAKKANVQPMTDPMTDAKKANVQTGTKTGSGAASTAVKKKKTRRTTSSAKSTAARSGKTAGAAAKARTEAKAAPDDAVKAAKGGNNSGSAENSKS